jgi:hypothetical protein
MTASWWYWANPTLWCSRRDSHGKQLDEWEDKLETADREQMANVMDCATLQTEYNRINDELADCYEKWGMVWPPDHATWVHAQKGLLSQHKADIDQLEKLIKGRKESIHTLKNWIHHLRHKLTQDEHDHMLKRLGTTAEDSNKHDDLLSSSAEFALTFDLDAGEEDEIDCMLRQKIHDRHAKSLKSGQEKIQRLQRVLEELKDTGVQQGEEQQEEEEEEDDEEEEDEEQGLSVLSLSQQ